MPKPTWNLTTFPSLAQIPSLGYALEYTRIEQYWKWNLRFTCTRFTELGRNLTTADVLGREAKWSQLYSMSPDLTIALPFDPQLPNLFLKHGFDEITTLLEPDIKNMRQACEQLLNHLAAYGQE